MPDSPNDPNEPNEEEYELPLTQPRFVHGWPWAMSLALHAFLIGGFGWLAFRTLHAREAEALKPRPGSGGGAMTTIAIELPGVAEGTVAAPRAPDRTGDPPRWFGGATTPRVDDGTAGHGGDRAASTPAVNLSDRDESMMLAPDPLSRLDRNQQARVRSARSRASWEDRRSTTNPMELTFLASGSGTREERRAPSKSDPSRGSRSSAAASVQGGFVGAMPQPRGEEAERQTAGAARDGSTASAPGFGVHDARAGLDHRAAADVMHARPDVALAPVSVPALEHARPRDDVDSDQEVAAALQAIVHASTAGGLAGDGRGGSGGGGDPAAGGALAFGSQGRPMGPGDSEWYDLNTNDPRLFPYFRRIHKKIDPLWAHAFPKSALLDLKQGTVILEVTIHGDGSADVRWPPVRPSGIDEFDRNCYAAVKSAVPFDPLPPQLGRTEIKVRMPFDAQNPVVK